LEWPEAKAAKHHAPDLGSRSLRTRQPAAGHHRVFRYAHFYPRAVALLASGKIDVKPLITDQYAFADSVEAFDFAKAMPPAAVKVQIEMPH
jgi:threonine dehydrogenase-like Zn-dependent dehydrogenase